MGQNNVHRPTSGTKASYSCAKSADDSPKYDLSNPATKAVYSHTHTHTHTHTRARRFFFFSFAPLKAQTEGVKYDVFLYR